MEHAFHVLDAAGALICSVLTYIIFKGLGLFCSLRTSLPGAVPQADLHSSNLEDFCGTWRRLRGGQWVQTGFGSLSASKVQVYVKFAYLGTKVGLG